MICIMDDRNTVDFLMEAREPRSSTRIPKHLGKPKRQTTHEQDIKVAYRRGYKAGLRKGIWESRRVSNGSSTQ